MKVYNVSLSEDEIEMIICALRTETSEFCPGEDEEVVIKRLKETLNDGL